MLVVSVWGTEEQAGMRGDTKMSRRPVQHNQNCGSNLREILGCSQLPRASPKVATESLGVDGISQRALDHQCHKRCSIRGWKEAKTTMPQKPKEKNISKPKAIVRQHMPMGSGQGGYQRPRTAEAMEARVG